MLNLYVRSTTLCNLCYFTCSVVSSCCLARCCWKILCTFRMKTVFSIPTSINDIMLHIKERSGLCDFSCDVSWNHDVVEESRYACRWCKVFVYAHFLPSLCLVRLFRLAGMVPSKEQRRILDHLFGSVPKGQTPDHSALRS